MELTRAWGRKIVTYHWRRTKSLEVIQDWQTYYLHVDQVKRSGDWVLALVTDLQGTVPLGDEQRGWGYVMDWAKT